MRLDLPADRGDQEIVLIDRPYGARMRDAEEVDLVVTRRTVYGRGHALKAIGLDGRCALF